MGDEVTARILDDFETAPIDDKLRVTLRFLKKVTESPDDVGAADASAVLRAGASPRAVVDALNVLFLFNILDRLADTLGWDVPPPGAPVWGNLGKVLLRYGYA
jgi:alkylhydroperoxidase family enzyme